LRVHSKSLLKLKAKLKMLTGRSNGMGYERRKVALHQVIRGWVSYFKYADAKTSLTTIDQWLRRRIRMCIWKSWKRPKTRIKNLYSDDDLFVTYDGVLVHLENGTDTGWSFDLDGTVQNIFTAISNKENGVVKPAVKRKDTGTLLSEETYV